VNCIKGALVRSTGRFVILGIAALLPGLPLGAQTPSVLEPKEPGKPLWISADTLANERFVDLLDRVGSVALRKYVQRQQCAIWQRVAADQTRKRKEPRIAALPPSACESVLLVAAEEDKPSSGLGDLLKHSRSIVRGTVRTTGFGFSFGIPFSLLGVEVSEAVQGPAPKSLIYVDYPVARFRIGPGYFCNGATGFEPRPGDEVLLFDYKGPIDRDDVLYVPHLNHLFFQSRDGTLSLPPRIKDDLDLEGVSTLDDVVGRLAAPGTWGGSVLRLRED
jgi:hypothetical protein